MPGARVALQATLAEGSASDTSLRVGWHSHRLQGPRRPSLTLFPAHSYRSCPHAQRADARRPPGWCDVMRKGRSLVPRSAAGAGRWRRLLGCLIGGSLLLGAGCAAPAPAGPAAGPPVAAAPAGAAASPSAAGQSGGAPATPTVLE